MPRGAVRERCPRCQSTHTKRHDILVLKKVTLHGVSPSAVQRWYCHECRRPFTPARRALASTKYTLAVHEQAALLYVDQGASYRAVARELRRQGVPAIDAKRCWALVQRLAANSPAPWQVSRELHPQWSGALVVDSKSLAVGGHREAMLVGVDVTTLDLPHLVLAEQEDTLHWVWFFGVLKHALGYPFRGVVSDGDPLIDYALTVVCPEIPHQRCVRHFQANLHRYLRYQVRPPHRLWPEIHRFEAAVRRCLYAPTLEDARQHLQALQADRAFHRLPLADVLPLLTRQFGYLTQHFRVPGLPRTTNVAEGMIRQFDRRLTAMDSFGSHQTAWHLLKLFTLYLRCKPLTDCRDQHKYRNGFSPLQLAGVDTRPLHWLRFSQHPHVPPPTIRPALA